MKDGRNGRTRLLEKGKRYGRTTMTRTDKGESDGRKERVEGRRRAKRKGGGKRTGSVTHHYHTLEGLKSI
jgi:hypothetical protein